MPPSMKCSPPTSTGGSSPGTAEEARIASTSGPDGEPVLGGGLDRRGDALEADRQVLDPRERERVAEQPAQALVVVQVRARAGERGQAAEDRAREHVAALEARPHLRQARDRVHRRLGGDGGAVDRPDRRPDDEIRRDAPLEQRAQHPHLVRAERPTASQDERDGARGRAAVVGHRRGRAGYGPPSRSCRPASGSSRTSVARVGGLDGHALRPVEALEEVGHGHGAPPVVDPRREHAATRVAPGRAVLLVDEDGDPRGLGQAAPALAARAATCTADMPSS